jgi:hypothetical protein
MVQELIHQDRINISNTCFIGNPDWVKKQYEVMNGEMKARVERRKAFEKLASSTDST